MNAPVPASALAFRGGADLAPTSGYETSSSALIERARVHTEAAYLFAARNPRDWEVVEKRLLDACSRPAFAAHKRTYYVMPYDSSIHGLGIGFVEEAIRSMRNLSIDKSLTYNSPEMEVYKVSVIDLESIIPYNEDVVVYKTVERSKPLNDGSAEGCYISKRKNSGGHWTYLVPAQEEDLKDKRAAAVSKAIRTCGLRLIPDWIKDACIERIYDVREDMASKDPQATARRLLVDLNSIGVSAEQVAMYLGKGIDQCAPKELVKLRGICDSIGTGEFTWADFADKGRDQPRDDAPRTTGASASPTQGSGRIERPQARPVQQASAANDSPAAGAQASHQGQQGATQQHERVAPTQASTQAAAAAAPAAPVSPACSEGQRRFLLKKFAGHAQQLAQALHSVGFQKLVDAPRSRVIQIVDTCDAAALAGLTEAQLAEIRANYMPALA